MKYYDKLVFELSQKGRVGYSLPANRFPAAPELPAGLRREASLDLPEVSEADVVRHSMHQVFLVQRFVGILFFYVLCGEQTKLYHLLLHQLVGLFVDFVDGAAGAV